jgi:hypothetical protein
MRLQVPIRCEHPAAGKQPSMLRVNVDALGWGPRLR